MAVKKKKTVAKKGKATKKPVAKKTVVKKIITEEEDLIAFDIDEEVEEREIDDVIATQQEERKWKKLTLTQERFCQLYVSGDRELFGNGTQSYIQAYGVDVSKKGSYDVARAGACENLAKPHIIDRINSLLEECWLNDQAVDKQLAFVIHQHADMSSKVSAIKEYNKLRNRIIEQKKVSGEIIVLNTNATEAEIDAALQKAIFNNKTPKSKNQR